MNTKTNNIIFWISTSIIIIFEGIIPAFTFQTEFAKEGMRTLGYPEYFGFMIVIMRIIGIAAILIPQVPLRLKEWAYAGFVFEFICAAISNTIVLGFGFNSLFPLIVMAILLISYFSFHRRNAGNQVMA
jgi:hypothetical protein